MSTFPALEAKLKQIQAASNPPDDELVPKLQPVISSWQLTCVVLTVYEQVCESCEQVTVSPGAVRYRAVNLADESGAPERQVSYLSLDEVLRRYTLAFGKDYSQAHAQNLPVLPRRIVPHRSTVPVCLHCWTDQYPPKILRTAKITGIKVGPPYEPFTTDASARFIPPANISDVVEHNRREKERVAAARERRAREAAEAAAKAAGRKPSKSRSAKPNKPLDARAAAIARKEAIINRPATDKELEF